MVQAEAPDRTPPLMSFSTFLTAVENLGSQGLPKRIDKSAFKSAAFNVQAQIITTLKFFLLIDDDGNVQPDLKKLTADADNRPAMIRAMLEARYPTIVELGASQATEQQLMDAIRAMGLKGDDPIRKAIAFYRKAAEYAGVTLSTYWPVPKPGPRAGGGSARRSRKKQGVKPKDELPPAPPSPPAMGNATSVPIHPMLAGAIQWLWERGSEWTVGEREMWSRNFVTAVEMVYPGGTKHRQTDVKRATNGKKSATEIAATVSEEEAPQTE